jgi:hypothetical protein
MACDRENSKMNELMNSIKTTTKIGLVVALKLYGIRTTALWNPELNSVEWEYSANNDADQVTIGYFEKTLIGPLHIFASAHHATYCEMAEIKKRHGAEVQR